MERSQYFSNNAATKLVQSFPQSSQTDTVVVTIYNIDTSTTEVNASAMTAAGNDSWYYSWTPTSEGIRLVKFYNSTLDVAYYLYAYVTAGGGVTPSGSSGGSTLTNLRTRFLKMIDNYNADDLTGTNSSGEVADLYINESLQVIYSKIKNSRYLDAYGSTSLATTADQAYIELSAISDLDELFSIKDTENDYTLIEIPKWRYFLEIPDPANSTGTPYRYCRIFNRIYLDPRPTSVITYTTEYKKTYGRLSADADQALIPSRMDKWVYDEAWVQWLRGEDSSNVSAIQLAMAERDRTEDIFLSDIGSQFARAASMRSHFGARGHVNYWRGIGIND